MVPYDMWLCGKRLIRRQSKLSYQYLSRLLIMRTKINRKEAFNVKGINGEIYL